MYVLGDAGVGERQCQSDWRVGSDIVQALGRSSVYGSIWIGEGVNHEGHVFEGTGLDRTSRELQEATTCEEPSTVGESHCLRGYVSLRWTFYRFGGVSSEVTKQNHK